MIDPYTRELSATEVAQRRLQAKANGRWDEIGRLQLEFLKGQGLQPTDTLLDVGCGPLRAGVHFIRYLNPGRYFGIDRMTSIIEAGRQEVNEAGLVDHQPRLLVNAHFDFTLFSTTFRYAIANSVFTHLPLNCIERCLVNMAGVLKPGGRFFASYFDAPQWPALGEMHHPDNITTYSDSNPYHYHLSAFEYLAGRLPLRVEKIDDWGHPRKLAMLVFTRQGSES